MAEKNAIDVSMYLGKQVRLIVDDGRSIEGEFRCMDKDLNFVLGSATEYHGIGASDIINDINTGESERVLDSRTLGMAMVPGSNIVKILIKD